MDKNKTNFFHHSYWNSSINYHIFMSQISISVLNYFVSNFFSLVLRSDGSRSKFFDPGRVGSAIIRFWFGKFPLKTSNISIISLRVGSKSTCRSKAGWPLIYCGSKVSSGWLSSGPISTVL